MILACPECGSKSSLDDRKVPSKAFQARCAKCGQLFKVDPAGVGDDDAEMAAVASELATPPAPVAADPGGLSREQIAEIARQEVRRAMALVLPGAPSVVATAIGDLVAGDSADERRALVCESDDVIASHFLRALATLGFRTERSADLDESMQRVEDDFNVVVVGHAFGANQDGGKEVLRKLAGWRPERRRTTLVAFVSPKFKSLDGLPAFVLAADIVIASSDAPRALDLLKEGIRGKEQMYRAFQRATAKLHA